MSTLNREIRKSSPLASWLTRHAQVAVATFGRIARSPIASLMTMLVIAVTLVLPATLHLGVKNAMLLSGGWESAADFSVFFAADTAEQDGQQLGELIASRADVESVRFVSAEAAKASFANDPVFAATLATLSENPLPHALVVRPIPNMSEASLDALHGDIANLPETDYVQLDTDWVKRFNAIVQLVQRGVGVMAGLLGIAVLIVIGNTIRLDILSRRDEIVVTKLVGASNGFIRRPFLYSGFVHGLAGGLIAVAILLATLHWLAEPVQQLAGLYASGFQLAGPNYQEILLIVGAGALLGYLGSFLATVRHLRQIEPR